jgi:hypothetical protein
MAHTRWFALHGRGVPLSRAASRSEQRDDLAPGK